MVEPRDEILTMPGYTPGRSVEMVARELGLKDVIKLASNESLWGTSERVLAAASRSLLSLYQYPEVVPLPLVELLAERSGFSPDEILVGNGADELLRLVATVYVKPGQKVIYPTPSFAAYAYSASLMGAQGVAVSLQANGAMDLEAMADRIDSNTALVYLCSPNNPTGAIFRQQEWDHFLERVEGRALIVVDQAYREFVDDKDYARIEDAIQQGLAVAMVRTFSKLYGLAGARVGWAAAPAPVIDLMRRVREPFSLNAIGIAAATEALRDCEYFDHVRQETLALRRWLQTELTRRGLNVLESQANFLTFACPIDATEMARRLEQQGIIIRPTTSFGLPQHCRVSIAPKPMLERFVHGLDRILAET